MYLITALLILEWLYKETQDMAMFIKAEGSNDDGMEWHLGQEIPAEMGHRVVEISADGDELRMIEEAMRRYQKGKSLRAVDSF